MKTVGLITLHRVNNFGSILQTYATILKIQGLGYSCSLIDYLYPATFHRLNAIGYENNIPQGRGLKNFLKKVLYRLHVFFLIKKIKIFIFEIVLNRKDAYYNDEKYEFFRKKLLKKYYTHICYNRKNILKQPPMFDIYVTGSDQTWNPRYLASDYSYLLNFAPDDKKKIAFSASFGVTQIPPRYTDAYQKLLARYDSISVRESSGIEIVKELTGKDAKWLLDPTLLLTKQEWQKIADYSRIPKGRFIFCYMMDYVFDPFSVLYSLLKKLNHLLDCQVYVWCEKTHYKDVLDHNLKILEDMRPEEFLAMYDKADYVVTNSFHGTAFSINFNKDFSVILNPKATKDSRVAEVLKNFELQERGIKSPDEFNCSPANLRVDFSQANQKLDHMRENSTNFLKNALENQEGA